ncbi:hypothetical protein CDAR_110601 [Caerostris darwini]|uniref:Uncharacterized protein n=1 Tax=Caerostris darwini TaxID=1538125 RepID=A0AAV4QJ03_9ARAC|nr:hypothetical protein CDAR_110601 [Caerostris darwini]
MKPAPHFPCPGQNKEIQRMYTYNKWARPTNQTFVIPTFYSLSLYGNGVLRHVISDRGCYLEGDEKRGFYYDPPSPLPSSPLVFCQFRFQQFDTSFLWWKIENSPLETMNWEKRKSDCRFRGEKGKSWIDKEAPQVANQNRGARRNLS